jgi:hypothetical protein
VPTSRGFGTRSLIASVESQLGGSALFDWRAEGLVCRLSVPLAKEGAQRQPTRHQSSAADGSASEPALRSAGAKA